MRLFSLLLATVVFTACYKETLNKARKINGVKWTGTYAVPAANIDIGLDDALSYATSKNPVGVVENQIIFLAYEKTIQSLTGEQWLSLSNQSHSFADKLSSGEQSTLVGSNSVSIIRNFSANYNHAEEIDSISYLGGSIDISLNNAYAHNATGIITFPDLTKNGVVVTQNVNAQANSNTNSAVNLAGCRLRLTNGGAGYNHLRCKLELTYSNSGNGFSGSEEFKIDLKLQNQKFARVWGYFGQSQFIHEIDSVDIGIFDQGPKIKSSNIHFADPRLKVIVHNSFGIPYNVNASNMDARKNGSSQGLVSGFPEIQNITAASGGGKIMDSTVKNSGNSNIKTIINNQPRYLSFDVKANTNPNGKTQRNYVDFDSRMTIKVWVELPFNGWAGKVEARDTTPLTLELGGADDYIEWITFRIETTNDLPLEVEFQGYFADSSSKILDSIFIPSRPFAKSSVVDANGKVVQSTHDVYNITFEKVRIKNIKTASQLILHATMRSADFNSSKVPVQLTSGQRFHLKLGVHTQLSAHEKF